MQFWELINKGIDYYERGMNDYEEKYFAEAKHLRKDAEYLIDIIHSTRNFKTMFECTYDKDTATIFNSYFTVINYTVKAYDNGVIEKDICEYILSKMMDLKAMFLKSVNLHLWLLTGEQDDSAKTIKLYDDFKEYLQINKKKLVSTLYEFNRVTNIRLTEYDIDLLTAWCYIIILNDYESCGSIDNGYVAKTNGIQWDKTFSSSQTRIELDSETVTYRMPRLMLICSDEEEYRKEYIRELKSILEKCRISERDVVKFQKDFSKQVFSYDKDNYKQYLSFDPFVNENIFGNKSGCRAYEAAVLASVSLCVGSAVFLQRSRKLLVCQAGGNSFGAFADPGAVLHLQWGVWEIPRLDQYCHLLYLRGFGLSI